MKFTEEELKKLREETKELVKAAEKIEGRFIENTDRIIEKMRATGFIS